MFETDKNNKNLFTAAAYCLIVAGAQPCLRMKRLGPSKTPLEVVPLRSNIRWADEKGGVGMEV